MARAGDEGCHRIACRLIKACHFLICHLAKTRTKADGSCWHAAAAAEMDGEACDGDS